MYGVVVGPTLSVAIRRRGAVAAEIFIAMLGRAGEALCQSLLEYGNTLGLALTFKGEMTRSMGWRVYTSVTAKTCENAHVYHLVWFVAVIELLDLHFGSLL